jgi:5-methylcytosine-specific restriction protein A
MERRPIRPSFRSARRPMNDKTCLTCRHSNLLQLAWRKVGRIVAYLYCLLWSRDHGRLVAGKGRSGKWAAVKDAWKRTHPKCAVCGGKTRPDVHHVRPYHLHPELELDKGNLVTLCRSNGCHFLFGHYGRWEMFNPAVKLDAAVFRTRARLARRRRNRNKHRNG